MPGHYAKSKGRPSPRMVLWIPVDVTDAGALIPNGIKTLLPSDLNTFFINGKPRNPPDFSVLVN